MSGELQKDRSSSEIIAIWMACQRLGGVDLATGIPSIDADAVAIEAASKALKGGCNSYSHPRGVPELRVAVAEKMRRENDLNYDPETEVLIVNGCTGAFAASMMSLFTRGDEVIVFEPFFGWHTKLIRMAGLEPRFVRLEPPGFQFSVDALRSAVSPKTRGLVLCTPANPSGKVFTRDELEAIGAFASEHDLLVVTDEQYEHFCFDGRKHIAPASVPSLRDRTVTIMGFSKSLAVTGWRIGYAAAPAPLIDSIFCIHQALYICPPTPLQWGVEGAMSSALARQQRECQILQSKRDMLAKALADAGLTVHMSEGGLFVLADGSSLVSEVTNQLAFDLLERSGVASVGGGDFYSDDSKSHLLRFCFAKTDEELEEGCRRLRAFTAKEALPAGVRVLDRTKSTAARDGKRDFEIRALKDEADQEAAARLAYEVYVEEFGILGAAANHEKKALYADTEHAYTLGAFEGDRLLGAFTSFLWQDHPFDEFYTNVFQVERFGELIPHNEMAIATRLLVRPERRGQSLLFHLFASMIEYLESRDIGLLFGDCQTHLLRLYEGMGMRAFGKPFNYGGSGMGIPVVGFTCDREYLEKQRSPILAVARPENEDRELAGRLRQLLVNNTPVVSRRSGAEKYWRLIDRMFAQYGGEPVHPFYGFSSEELHRVLKDAFVVECERGIELITKAQRTRTVYVVLEGELEVTHERGRREMGVGSIVGEVAYLTDGCRTADVLVSSERAQILTLTERVLKRVSEGEPALAARFFGNLSRILANRLSAG